ncbi:DUF4907 domain-containing protein [Adhaeribacter soli]|uniref:DUF4907 domain-containing protein n=1 Tax=Adhaeribacter soli TaxID=2607655 RepID=A0A5N1IQZ6_9BACT|nr:DUF4907 domain-containing protein [Adhaeribacter soli]KAA9325990.1 DUF4907 domain-containing protein [Adhaeribacter soli]
MKIIYLVLLVILFSACSKQKKEFNQSEQSATEQLHKQPFPPTRTTAAETSVSAESGKTVTAFPEATPAAAFSFQVMPSEGGTFGYEILKDGRPLIRQTSVPGLAGNKGFKTKDQAEKVAGLVIKKLKNGEMPPTITMEELKELNVLN